MPENFDYSIGGTDRKQEASEAISELEPNRTLLVQKLTSEAPMMPQMVKDLTTPEEVFNHFKPNVNVEYENEDGSTREENLRFASLADFGPKGISNKSAFIQDLVNQENTYMNIVKELKSNRAVQTALQNKETKTALLTAIAAMITELENKGA